MLFVLISPAPQKDRGLDRGWRASTDEPSADPLGEGISSNPGDAQPC